MVGSLKKIGIYRHHTNFKESIAQPLDIFRWTHSATQITGTMEREPYQDAFNPTSEEIIKAFNSISTNTGRYVATDSTLLTLPIIAKVPAYSGGRGIHELTIDSDTLYLSMIEEHHKNGTESTWLDNLKVTLKLIRIEE